MKNSLFVKRSLLFIVIVGLLNGCVKFLEVDKPKDKITGDQAFQNVDTAVRSVVGIYSEISNAGNIVWGYATVYAGVYSDELLYTSSGPSLLEFYTAAIDPDNEILEKWFWAAPYKFIHHINRCLEGLNATNALPQEIRDQLIGECSFLRALLYFHLVQLFGDVPLVKVTDYTVTSTLPRANVDLVWKTIFSDLRIAEELLPASYPSEARVRANKWSAAALLARCYLYKHQWAMADTAATEVINSGLYSLEKPENVFLSASKEAIFQILPTMTGYSTMEGFLIIPVGNVRPVFELRGSLLALFEPGDKRKDTWTRSRTISGRTYYYPFKYTKRPVFSAGFKATEYTTLFRLAEMYLIRAESRLALGASAKAIEDVNVVRQRAGLPLIDPADRGIDETVLSGLIERERQVELFAEGGLRWFDLKRSTRLDSVMSEVKSAWKKEYGLWPIPRAQITLNPALSQNPGYQ